MSDRAAYSRVYWSIIDDPDFHTVYDDDRLLAAWLRLLLIADQAWPASAHLPSVRKSALDGLEACGLVIRSGNRRYRIKGLDAERERRKALATTRRPSGTRAVPVRSPVVPAMREQAETSLDETRQAKPSARADDPADAYWQLTGKYPTDKTLGWIDDLTSKFGHEAVIRALAAAYTADRVTATLLGRAQDILRSESRELDRREREDEQRRLREKRAVPRQEEPWRIEQRKAYLERYGPDAA